MADSGNEVQENDEVPGRLKDKLCQPCLSNDMQTVANKFCSTCYEFQCNDCSNVHNVLAILKNHKLVSVTEANAARVLFDMKGLDLCDQHKKLYEFYCEDENKICCSTCAIVNHRKCNSVVEIEMITDKTTSQISSLGEKLKKARKVADDIARDILSSKDQLAQNVKEIQENIKRMREDVVTMFNDLERSVVSKAKALQTGALKSLTKKQSQNKRHLNDIITHSDTIESIYKTGTTVQKYIAEQKMESEVNLLCRNVTEAYQRLENVNISFHFDDTLKLPPLPVTEYVPGNLILNSQRKGDASGVNTIMSLTPVSSVILKKTGDDIVEPFYTGLDFLTDGRLVAVDNKNKKCLVYSDKLEKVGSYQLSYSPLSVVVVSEDDIAVTGVRIEFLHVTKCNEIRSRRTYQTNKIYNSISLKDDNQFVVGTYNDAIPVRIVPFSGKERDFDINFSNKTYSAGGSACTYIKSSEKLVLTDRYEHSVNICDIKTKTRVIVKDDQIKQPCGVAVSPSDTILVCIKETNSIVQISQTGRILSSHKIDMIKPYSICVSLDKSYLVVTNTCVGKRKMQKFKISL